MPARPTVLYVSDLIYPARGRRSCDEDIYLTSQLRDTFDLAVCHPEDAASLMEGFDTVVVRNSGPMIDYPDAYAHFREQAKATGQRVYNPLTGKADMAGKQYLLDLTGPGYPVIPTIDHPAALDRLPRTDRYVVKPKVGADSHGLEFVGRDELAGRSGDVLIQPEIDFRYEVSFYFVDHDFQYALHAPDPAQRWELTRYDPPRKTSNSRRSSSTGTTSTTASSASTPAARRRETCSWWEEVVKAMTASIRRSLTRTSSCKINQPSALVVPIVN